MGVRFTSRIDQWQRRQQGNLDVAALDLVTVIHRDAGTLAPEDTSALINSGRIVRNGLADYSVVFGGGQVPYARMRHYVNRRNPQTLGYLEKAGDSNSRNLRRFIRGR